MAMAQKCSDKNIVTLCLSYANSSCYENQKNAQKRYSLTKTNQMMIIKKKLHFNEKLLYFKENGSKNMKEYKRIYRLIPKKRWSLTLTQSNFQKFGFTKIFFLEIFKKEEVCLLLQEG